MFYEDACDELLKVISRYPVAEFKRDGYGFFVFEMERAMVIYRNAPQGSYLRSAGQEELLLLLSIIIEDGYVSTMSVENGNRYYVTNKGRVWMAKGGYTIQRRKESNKRQLRNIERIVLALGTLAAGIAGIDYLVSDELIRSILVSIFLSGMAALILPILSSEVRTRLQGSSRVDKFRSMDDQSYK